MSQNRFSIADSDASNGLRPITVRIRDACRITGIGRSKLYELIKAGEIETIKVGALTLLPLTSIEDFLRRVRGMTG